jgi:hypothetical protein
MLSVELLEEEAALEAPLGAAAPAEAAGSGGGSCGQGGGRPFCLPGLWSHLHHQTQDATASSPED